jgi:hypothetical protein
MDPESITGKLLFSAIDKIVLGVIAASILFAMQQCNDKAEDKRERIAAVSQIYTNIVETALSDIQEQMYEFLVIVEKARSEGKLSNKDALVIDKTKMRMRVNLETAAKFGPIIGKPEQNFLDKTDDLMNTLLQNNLKENAVSQHQEQVMTAYRELIDTMKQALVNAVNQEWAK